MKKLTLAILALATSITGASAADDEMRLRFTDAVFAGPAKNYLGRKVGDKCVLPSGVLSILGEHPTQGLLGKVVAVDYQPRMEGVLCPAGGLVFVERDVKAGSRQYGTFEASRDATQISDAALAVLLSTK
jgi:hypothetical protein